MKEGMLCLDMFNPKINPNLQRAIFKKEFIWKSGQIGNITITFGDYPCNDCTRNASWSLIGSDANNKPYPSMNLGWVDPPFEDFEYDGTIYLSNSFIIEKRVGCEENSISKSSCKTNWEPGMTIIHEFGHALGMVHEHQNDINKDNPYIFNVPVVEEYMAKPENGGWSKERVNRNIIQRYTCDVNNCDYIGSGYDEKSVMNYSFPSSWLLKGSSGKTNYRFSEKDKEWLRNVYPLNNPDKPVLNIFFLDPYAPEWKKAWVKKVVTDYIQPYVGIEFKFRDDFVPLPPGETFPPPTTAALSPLNNLSILIIVISSMILFGIMVYYVK